MVRLYKSIRGRHRLSMLVRTAKSCASEKTQHIRLLVLYSYNATTLLWVNTRRFNRIINPVHLLEVSQVLRLFSTPTAFLFVANTGNPRR
jgi:hypothetical protein